MSITPDDLTSDDLRAILDDFDPDWRDHWVHWENGVDFYHKYSHGEWEKAIGEYCATQENRPTGGEESIVAYVYRNASR